MNNQPYLNNCLSIINNYSHLGTKITSNGVKLIGHVPHIAPQAWLHKIYPPITQIEIDILESKIGIKINDTLKGFFLKMNGIKLFGDTLAIYGYIEIISRDIENPKPYSIINLNTIERLPKIDKDILFIGGYDWDGSLLYTNKSEKVFRCSTDNINPLNEWDSFWDMLYSEIVRISTLFSLDGKELNSNVPTIP